MKLLPKLNEEWQRVTSHQKIKNLPPNELDLDDLKEADYKKAWCLGVTRMNDSIVFHLRNSKRNETGWLIMDGKKWVTYDDSE